MGTAKKTAIAFIVLANILAIIFVSSYLYVFRGGKIGFVSRNPSLKFNIQRQIVSQMEDIYVSEGLGLTIVYLSPDTVDRDSILSNNAAGFIKDRGPIYYADWGKWQGIAVLNIYVDKEEWDLVEQENKDKVLGLFVSRQISKKIVIDKDKGNEVSKLVISSQNSVGIVEK